MDAVYIFSSFNRLYFFSWTWFNQWIELIVSFYIPPHFSYDELSIWSTDKCTPLVREITFENAEELTEEGLPFLILFHAPEDNESIKQFSEIVQRDLMEDKREKLKSCWCSLFTK